MWLFWGLRTLGDVGIPRGTHGAGGAGEMEEIFQSLFQSEVNSLHKEGCGYSTTTRLKFDSSNYLNLYSLYHIEFQPDYVQQFFTIFFSLDLASPAC